MMKKLTILAAMVLVMLALASPAMADNDRHNNRFDDDDRSHGNVIHVVDDDVDWGSSRGWNWGDYEDCWEWSSVFEEWQWDCD